MPVAYRRALIIAVAVLAVCYAAWRGWDAYRDVRRHAFAAKAIAAASELRPAVAERLGKNVTGAALGTGLRVAAKPPVTGGYVASNGAIVVNAELDYSVPFTVILAPTIDSTRQVAWACAVADEGQLRYASPACQRVAGVPGQ